MIRRNSVEVELEDVLQRRSAWSTYKTWGGHYQFPWDVQAFGREHLLPGVGLPDDSALRYAPDFLVQAKCGKYRNGSPRPPYWSIFLECKSSRHESLAIAEQALKGYERWQAFSGITVYIATRLASRSDKPKVNDFYVMPIRQILNGDYPTKRFSTWDYETDRYDHSVVSDPNVMVPKADFIWPLADLLDQKVAGKKRPQWKEAKACA